MPCWIRHVGLLAVLLLTCVSRADDPPAPAKPQNGAETPPVGPAAPAAGIADFPFDIRYLLGDDGQPVAVPDGVHVRGYLNWLALEQTNQLAPIPYSVTRITCTGTEEDHSLHLTVVVRIRTTSDEWVFVPLQMAEGTLREPPQYSGPSGPNERPLQVPYHPEAGYAWWFKGKKGEAEEHVLTLSLLVDIRKQAAVRRVQLSLPPTAVSSLKLRVPHGRVTPKVAERSKVSVKNGAGSSEIEVIGLGPRMDVAWQVSPDLPAVDTTLEVVTAITATLAEAERTATLVATQTIRSVGQQATFDEVRVTLPKNGELLSIGSSEYQEDRRDPNDPSQVIVKLQRQTTGPVDLRWTVRIPLPPTGGPFVIEGFDVARARIHSGSLAVVVVGNSVRLSQASDVDADDPQDRSVQRINTDALPAPLRQARPTAAYRFENRLRLKLELRRDVPLVSASSDAWMQIDQETIRVGATYEFQVLRGSLSEASFRWPGWKEAGWIIDRIEASENLGPPLLDEAAAPDKVRIEFTEPAQKRFRLTIFARRAVVEGATLISFALPIAETSTPPTARLAVLTPQNLEFDLQPVDGTDLRPPTDATARVSVPRDLQKLHRDEYRIESHQASFRATIAVHPREVTASTSVSAAQDRPGMTIVRQRVTYNVAFGSLAEVRFSIPNGLKPSQLLVAEADGNELANRSTDDPMGREVRVPLDPPRTGRFELDLQYAFETPGDATPGGEQALGILLVTSNDADFTSTQFQWRDAQGREAAVRGDGWTRFPDPNGLWTWKCPRAVAEIDVVLSQSAGAWSGVAVTRALIQSKIGLDGTIRTRAEYRLTGAVLELAIELPANVQLESATWDRQKLKLSALQIEDGGTKRYRIAPDRFAGAMGVLTLVTTAPGAALSRFSSVSELTAPRLPENLPVLECRWQVTMPFGRHLFTRPDGFAPAFRWKPSGFFWSRQPDRTTVELANWIGAVERDGLWDNSNEGNTYLFSRAGAANSLRFRTMSQSGIVFVGASLALFLGWTLVKWPVTRHVLTLLIFGFVVSLLAVWFSEPVIVLLQPAGLGFLLAVVAAGIDAYSKRRTRPLAVALNSPSGYMTPASSVSRKAVLGIGSNEYTSVRLPESDHRMESNDPAGQLSETGSRP